MATAPYGCWTSPITARRLVEGAVSLSQVAVDGVDVYWNEGRPQEGGRQVVVRWSPGASAPVDVLPAGFSARTTVHEYGGAAFAVRDGVVWFSNQDDQRVYRMDPRLEPRPITPSPPASRSVRFADFDVSPDATRLVAVRERHLPDGRVVNDLVLLDADPRPEAEPEVVADGHDFFSAPRFAPDGRLCWLSWDHPHMPWDSTWLWVTGQPTPVAGGHEESVSQPRWGPEGRLHWVSDITGWWNLYREGAALAPDEADYTRPDWGFGQATYALLEGGAVVAARSAEGIEGLTVDGTPLPTPYTAFTEVRPYGPDAVVAVAASSRDAPAVMRIGLDGRASVIRASRPAVVGPDYLSQPVPVTFGTEGGEVAHALFYAPANPEFEAPPGELPPLVVMCHGGPTYAARPELSLAIQYFTSRGLAVADVNYRGSSGYGRAYRHALDGRWGVADVADCVNAARHLAAEGRVDGARVVIRGASAGGYTTLCALIASDAFAAGASYYGVADLAALVAGTHKFEAHYLDRLVGPLPEAEEVYRARSPVFHAGRIEEPVILFQGLQDKAVPPSQAEAMVEALRAKGVPFAYVTFPDEAHGFRKAENIVEAAEDELWLYGHALGFEVADDIEPVPLENA